VSASARRRRRESERDREHRYDREVISAVYRRERAVAGRGYAFKIPAKALR
jgi:hypothetical protein